MSILRFVIHESPEDGQWYVRIQTANNEPWFTSEGYPDEHYASESARHFLTTVQEAESVVFDVRRAD